MWYVEYNLLCLIYSDNYIYYESSESIIVRDNATIVNFNSVGSLSINVWMTLHADCNNISDELGPWLIG